MDADGVESVIEGVIRRRASGEELPDAQVIRAHPDLMPVLERRLAALHAVERAEVEAGRLASVSGTAGPGELSSAFASELPREFFEGYELLGAPHRGGQGLVYRAIQKSTRREVAIKVMRDGLFARSSGRERFEREAVLLGRIKHPNIVSIYHGGAVAGHHYFVMDYIQGIPVDVFVSQQGRNPREILELFLKICSAIRTAHSHGIIHRDLKPSNILIDEAGEPHVLDFGLAKAMDDEDGNTMTGQFIGSAPWASPEQAGGERDRIDVRTDVYSLGVILFQLLTSRFPYRVDGHTRDTLNNIIESQPPRPSSIGSGIDADADAIVLKCLAKEPERRYQAAGMLEQDVQRYLAGESILARAPTTSYQLRRIVSRHKLATSLLALFFMVVSAFLVGLSILYSRAEDQRRRAVLAEEDARRGRADAEAKSKTARAISDFLVNDLLDMAEPAIAQGRNITVREALTHAALRVDDGFKSEPMIAAALHRSIGSIYCNLGIYDEAEAHLLAAASGFELHAGALHPDSIDARLLLARTIVRRGDYLRASSMLPDLESDARRSLGPDHGTTLEARFLRGIVLRETGDSSSAYELQSEVLKQRRLHYGDGDPATIESINEVGDLMAWNEGSGRLTESLFREAYENGVRALGANHPQVLRAMVHLGWTLYEQRKWPQAELLLVEGHTNLRIVLGDRHPSTLMATARLALLRREQNRCSEATQLIDDAKETGRDALPLWHPIQKIIAQTRAGIDLRCGRFGRALEGYEQLYQTLELSVGHDRPETAFALADLMLVNAFLGRWREAEEYGRAAVQLLCQLPRERAWRYRAGALRILIRVLALQGKFEECRPYSVELLALWGSEMSDLGVNAYLLNCYARDLLTIFPVDLRQLQRGLSLAQRAMTQSDESYHYNRYIVGHALAANGRRDEAVDMFRRALNAAPMEASTERAEYEAALSSLLDEAGEHDRAEDVYRQSLARRRELHETMKFDVSESLEALSVMLIRHQKPQEALTSLRECASIRRELFGESDWRTLRVRVLSAIALPDESNRSEQQTMLSSIEAALRRDPGAPAWVSDEARLAQSDARQLASTSPASHLAAPVFAGRLP